MCARQLILFVYRVAEGLKASDKKTKSRRPHSGRRQREVVLATEGKPKDQEPETKNSAN